jgi:MFS family permease
MRQVLNEAIDRHSLNKLGLLGSLYVSQLMPAFFAMQALPTLMRSTGSSLVGIGLFYLLYLPLALKFLWSPFIDRYGFTRWGHYRFWIICFQLLIAGITASLAWVDFSHSSLFVFIGVFAIGCCSASLDIATDALAVRSLEPQERGLGNAVQSSGSYLGAAIGGGGMLFLFDRWGWKTTLLVLSLLMVVALVPVLRHREQVRDTDKPAKIQNASYLKTFIHLYHRPKMKWWLLFLWLYTLGSSMAGTIFRLLLVDLKIPLSQLAWLMGVVDSIAAVLGGIVGGFVINRLGRKRSLLLACFMWAIATISYLLPTFGIDNLPTIYLVTISTMFAYGMMGTATFTLMMDRSQLTTAGTDFTFQDSVSILGAVVGGAIGGIFAAAIGYLGVFTIVIAIAFAVIWLATVKLSR